MQVKVNGQLTDRPFQHGGQATLLLGGEAEDLLPDLIALHAEVDAGAAIRLSLEEVIEMAIEFDPARTEIAVLAIKADNELL